MVDSHTQLPQLSVIEALDKLKFATPVKYTYDSFSHSKTAHGNRVYQKGALCFVFKGCVQCLEGCGPKSFPM